MNRIGLLGGTFNPIHIGHLTMAQIALERLRLKKVIFIPSNLPPHKIVKGLVPALHRYAMVRLAIQGYPHFEVSDVEVKRKGKSYSIDTIKYFHSILSARTKLYFIIGEDALARLHTWKEFKKIQKLVSFIVVNRPGYKHRAAKSKYHFVNMPEIDIASSFLRNRIAERKSIKYFVPERVYRYIKRHQLYQY